MNRNKEKYMLVAATSWRYLALFVGICSARGGRSRT
jgi:hypothetical protein